MTNSKWGAESFSWSSSSTGSQIPCIWRKQEVQEDCLALEYGTRYVVPKCRQPTTILRRATSRKCKLFKHAVAEAGISKPKVHYVVQTSWDFNQPWARCIQSTPSHPVLPRSIMWLTFFNVVEIRGCETSASLCCLNLVFHSCEIL